MTVTQDATSGKYIPQSGAEFTTLLAGSGIANPDLAWMFSQASGNSSDLIGSIAGVPSGPFSGPAFHQSVTGWATQGILLHNGNADIVSSTAAGLPDLSTTSMLVFMWSDIPNRNRGLLSIGAQSQSPIDSVCANPVGSANNFALSSNGHSDSSTLTDADGNVHAIALQLNRDALHSGAAQLQSLTTENGQTSTSIDTSGTGPNGKSLTVGGGDFSAGGGLAAGNTALYLAAWFGTNAELTLAKIVTLVGLFSTGPAPSGGGRLVNSPLTKSGLSHSPLAAISARRARHHAALLREAA